MPIGSAVSISSVIHKKILKLMGNRFEITVVSENENEALARIDEAIVEIRRIEKLLTTFDENSQTNLINRYAGVKPVKVDREMVDIIQRSKRSLILPRSI